MSDGLPVQAVVAIGRNGAIGRDGALPWHVPSDLARFKAATAGTPMIMGRRTWASIGRALPGRESIVVTSRADLPLPEGVHRAAGPEAALATAQACGVASRARAVSLIGGAAIFAALLPVCRRLVLTIVDLEPEADTFFPPVDPAVWREVSRHVPPRRADDEASCTFIDYERR